MEKVVFLFRQKSAKRPTFDDKNGENRPDLAGLFDFALRAKSTSLVVLDWSSNGKTCSVSAIGGDFRGSFWPKRRKTDSYTLLG